MNRYIYSVILGTAAALVLWACASYAVTTKYVEGFTTTQYKDTLNTTAWWNTAAGKLSLYPFVPTLVGSYDTPGSAWGIFVSGDHAFVADWGYGLLVINISNPASPTLVGSYDTPGTARGVFVSGDHAFVADAGSGLQVIDISNPAAPTLAGSYHTTGQARSVYVSGDHTFIGGGTAGLQVIDISNPATPTLAGTYDTPGTANVVKVSGDFAFVADADFGLQVIDISNPAAPTLAGTYDTPGTAFGVCVSGDIAYMGDGDAGLQVIDISNPAAPTLVGTYDTQGAAYGVFVSGYHAFVADDTSGIQVIGISNPAAPTLVGNFDTQGNALGVYVSGENAFMTDGLYGLQVIRISNSVDPTLTGSYRLPGPGLAFGVHVSGDHAFVADNFWPGLRVIDIRNPATPTLAGTYITPDGAFDVYISGDHAFVAGRASGLHVISISNPAAPTLVGTYNTPGDARAVYVSGDHAFVADWESGLQVVDISNPAAPTLVGTYDTSGEADGVYVSGDHAFVADRTSGLQVIDISNPAAPTLVGTYDTPGSAWGIFVSGDHAFVADWESGLQVMDISNPAAPTLVGTYNTPGDARAVYVSGDHAFVGDEGYGLHIIRVFQSEIDAENNIGRSLAVDACNDTVLLVRLTTSQTDSVMWEVSADSGASWQGIEPDGNWNQLAVPGSALMWRSTHAWKSPDVNPSVTDLEINWIYAAAEIESIVDVPDDQGGWARVYFTRSVYDFAEEQSTPVEQYFLYRRVDNPAMQSAVRDHGETVKTRRDNLSHIGSADVVLPSALYGTKLVFHGDSYFVFSQSATSGFPPGIWEVVGSAPAHQQDLYVVLAPTMADSAATLTHSVYVISTETTTPSIWFVSEPESGYSVDNIAPAVPTSFAVAYNTGGGNQLSWDPCPDDDFQYFCVYRSDDPQFVPAPTDLVHTTIAASWNDQEYDGWNVYYKITALDFVGNESPPASAGTVTAVTESMIPQAFALYQNVPNPFNPVTTIRYDVPARGGEVTLRIYDVSGRLVRTLVDGTEGPGEKTVAWDGRNDRGRMVASGVYFYRLTSEAFTKTRKMLLMK